MCWYSSIIGYMYVSVNRDYIFLVFVMNFSSFSFFFSECEMQFVQKYFVNYHYTTTWVDKWSIRTRHGSLRKVYCLAQVTRYDKHGGSII